jgi:hypothetical protein
MLYPIELWPLSVMRGDTTWRGLLCQGAFFLPLGKEKKGKILRRFFEKFAFLNLSFGLWTGLDLAYLV